MPGEHPSDQTDIEKQILKRSLQVIDFCESYAENFFTPRNKYKDMYHSYDAEMVKRKEPWQSQFSDTFPYLSIQQKSAFIIRQLFGNGTQPILTVDPWNEGAFEQANILSKVFKSQFDSSDFKRDLIKMVKEFGYFGDAFLEVFWNYKERPIRQNRNFLLDINRSDGANGASERDKLNLFANINQPNDRIGNGFQLNKNVQQFDDVEKDQPDAESIYVNNVWIDPEATRIQDARYVCVRKEFTWDALKMKESQGRYVNVDMIKHTHKPKMHNEFYLESYNKYELRREAIVANAALTRENPVVEVIDIWENGRVTSIANRSIVIGAQVELYDALGPNETPIIHFPNNQENERVYGFSDYEQVERVWKTSNSIRNMMVDNMHFNLTGMHIVGHAFGVDGIEQLKRPRPNGLILSNNPQLLRNYRPDLFPPTVDAYNKDLVSLGKETIGANEVLGGGAPPSNIRDSQSFNALAAASSSVIAMSLDGITTGLTELGRLWLGLNHQFLDVQRSFPVIGPSVQEFVRLQPQMIPHSSNVRVRLSAIQEAFRNETGQRMLQAINLANQAPGFNFVEAMKNFFRLDGAFDDPDRLWLLDEQEVSQLLTQDFIAQLGNNNPNEPGLAGGVQNSVAGGGGAPAQTPVNANQAQQGNQQNLTSEVTPI